MSCHLPTSRIKIIMKSSAEVDVVSQESLNLVTRATELFIKHLAREALKHSNGKTLNYSNLSDVVHQTERFDFLAEILPKKVTYKEYKVILMDSGSDDSSSSDSGGDRKKK